MLPKSVTESVMQRLREEIITGKLPAGSRLNEVGLSNRFKISRPPLREAFQMLKNVNLVTNYPRKGSYVMEMSIEDCKQIYRARIMIESTAIDIIRRLPNSSTDSLRKALELARQNDTWPDSSGAVVNYYNLMADFHFKLVERSNNKWLTHCYHGIGWNLARYQIIYLKIPGSYQPSQKEHDFILDLIESREFTKAKVNLIKHIRRTQEKLIARMHDHMPVAESTQPACGLNKNEKNVEGGIV